MSVCSCLEVSRSFVNISNDVVSPSVFLMGKRICENFIITPQSIQTASWTRILLHALNTLIHKARMYE